MNTDELKSLQAPLKERYKSEPGAAQITLRAHGRAGEGISCSVETGRALVTAGLHPATGGDGTLACSGDMLLEALVACAGVTLRAVATAIGVELQDATVTAEGDLDFRGTLGVAKDARVGFGAIRLHFDLATDGVRRSDRDAAQADGALLRRSSDAPPAAGRARDGDAGPPEGRSG